MGDLAPVIAIAIVTWGIYRLFELYARRNERLKIIEKLNEINCGGEIVNLDIFPKRAKASSFSLTVGLLLMGIGLGLLVGYIIFISSIDNISLADKYEYREIKSIIIGSCVLLFGGLGLLTTYLIERKQDNKNK